MPLAVTTTKTARMELAGANPTLAEIAAAVEQSVALHIPDGATVEVLRHQAGGITRAALHLTWTSGEAQHIDRRA